MKVLVTGANGQLGWDMILELKKRGHEPIATDIMDSFEQDCEYIKLDITDESSVRDVIEKVKPDAVAHCAAWTAVDAAEDEENKPKVKAINADGTRNIAEACKKIDCKLIYISTDYVFNGQGELPWKPDCKDYKPLNYYGQTKLEGELAVSEILDKFFVVRIAWVFGIHGNNFVKTMLKLTEKNSKIRVVDDQVGTPTYTYDLAKLLVDMAQSEKYGYYHATNEGGFISWYEFACEILRQAQKSVKVVPVSTKEYGVSKAARPFNSRLDKTKLSENGFITLPDWKDALSRYMKEAKLNANLS